MSTYQAFTAPDGTEMVIITRERHEELLAAEEDAEDLAAAMNGRESISREGSIPPEVSADVRAGKNPVFAWRRYRTLTQSALAQRVGVTQAAIGRIEAGPAGCGRDDTLRKIADVLEAPIAHINPPPETPRDKMRKAMANSMEPATGRLMKPSRANALADAD